MMCDYFSAADDETAVHVLDQPGGPNPAKFDVVPLKGIDPVVMLAQLEAILTGCTYDEASTRPRSGQLLTSPEDEAAFVVSVSDTLQEALAMALQSALAEAAQSWSQTDEGRQQALTSETALDVLILLSGLAGRARSAGLRLYCWWSL